MHKFRIFSFLLITLSCALSLTAQRLEDVLASSNRATYTAASLSPNAQKYYLERRKLIADTRTDLLNRMVGDLFSISKQSLFRPLPKSLSKTSRAKSANRRQPKFRNSTTRTSHATVRDR
jgi:hypothetical protein